VEWQSNQLRIKLCPVGCGLQGLINSTCELVFLVCVVLALMVVDAGHHALVIAPDLSLLCTRCSGSRVVCGANEGICM